MIVAQTPSGVDKGSSAKHRPAREVSSFDKSALDALQLQENTDTPGTPLNGISSQLPPFQTRAVFANRTFSSTCSLPDVKGRDDR
jgi:hypothetical protein